MRAKVAKISLKQMSEQIGVTTTTLRRWKAEGKFNMDDFKTVVRLYHALDLMKELGFWQEKETEFRQRKEQA